MGFGEVAFSTLSSGRLAETALRQVNSEHVTIFQYPLFGSVG